MININAQEYINEKYPIDGVCKRDNDPENKGKRREEITTLDLSKGKVGKDGLFSEEKNLIGSLKLESFINLQTLTISSHQITSLDVSNCSNLEELYCKDNQLTNLNVTNCSNLYKINCSSNNNLKELDLTTCINLDEVDINGCSKLTEEKIKSDLSYNAEDSKLIKSGLKISGVKENVTRNILIIGITGNGKSALANTLVNTSTDNKFEEKSSTTSVTKIFKKSEPFEWKGKEYCVIDNIGFGDTNNVTEEVILNEIGKGIHSAKEGINQILFVFRGRFSPEHVIAYNIFKKFISESKITEFTTIIRTGFESFRNKKKREEDRDSLLAQNEELRKLIESCNEIIYVDNPAIPEEDSEDSEDEMERKKNKRTENKKTREKSRKIVLDYLAENCQKVYKLGGWDNIYQKVDRYVKKKAEIEKNDSPTKEIELKQAKAELFETIKGSVGISIPGFPVEFQAAIEHTTYTKYR